MPKPTQNGPVLAIDLGGSKLEAGLVDARGKVLDKQRESLLGDAYTPRVILSRLGECVRRLKERNPGITPRVAGISIPAPCDPAKGLLIENRTTGLKEWHFGKDVGALLGIPVFGENDVNACAVAEKAFGNCKEANDYIWVTLSHGCGGALFLGGRLYRGRSFMAGEVGHIALEFLSPTPCACGIAGDLEAEGSGRAIGRKYLRMTGQAPDPEFQSRQVGELARAGNQVALRLFREAGWYLGRVCAMGATLLNLQKAVLGGGVVIYDYALLKDGLEEALDTLTFPLAREGFSVEVTALGYDAALLGAAAVAFGHGRE